ncbi:hypothetical protein GCM10009691_27640 [Brevibacterium picturae]|uniref:Helix-turn-helix domain-containing protein n=1 Tax=Brevibacterium picturae TaxID=260553 RepID=A0ABP4MWK8_9MICO
MGFNNVVAARRFASTLKGQHLVARVLIEMALMSQDNDTEAQEARIYFGGHGDLALNALGDPDDTRAVARAIKILIDLGILERIAEARRGRNAEYRLLLDYQGKGYNSVVPKPVDNSAMGTTQTYPIENGMGTTQLHERVQLSGSSGYNSLVPLQEDKKHKISPYPLADDSERLPVDNFQGEEDQNLISVADLESAAHTDFTADPAEPRPAATDEASAARTRQVPGSGSVLSPWDEERPSERPASTRSQSARRVHESTSPASRQDRDALAVLTADGTDQALAQDMLDRAKRDPDTKVPAARIKQPKYREELRSAVIRDRNHAHALAAKTAGPCPHGELGGLVPTRAGKPTCATCRAEHNRQKESA